ncbi:hypothetical protein EYF80_027244 [Liparis tanakae]|uniref:Uncharacterized protein n=1 Tax=Liparis tanakae TaxID=230148 RepID=A0A4Z2HAA5_9TELE|nr:hypothetical protein EYF80_027244 [Liparis tanakae]
MKKEKTHKEWERGRVKAEEEGTVYWTICSVMLEVKCKQSLQKSTAVSAAACRSHRLPSSWAVLKTEAWPAGCRDWTFCRFCRVRSISADTMGKCCSWIKLALAGLGVGSRWPESLGAARVRWPAGPRKEQDIFFCGGSYRAGVRVVTRSLIVATDVFVVVIVFFLDAVAVCDINHIFGQRESGDCFGVDQLEDPHVRIGPFDVAGADLPVLQQLHQELPQVHCAAGGFVCNECHCGWSKAPTIPSADTVTWVTGEVMTSPRDVVLQGEGVRAVHVEERVSSDKRLHGLLLSTFTLLHCGRREQHTETFLHAQQP